MNLELSGKTRPVRRNLLSVSGVPDPDSLLDASLEPLVVGLGPRRIRCEEDVLFVPFAGLVDRHGATLPDGQLRRLPGRLLREGAETVTPVKPLAILDREGLFLGRFRFHFGHFLLEAMARWWAVAHVPRDMPLLWLCDPNLDLERARGWLESFGIATGRVMLVTQPLRVRRLLLPDHLLETRSYIHEEAARPFRDLGDLLAGTPPLTGQPLYLSRAGLPEWKRHYLGEDRFEEYLRREGVRVIRPETLPVAEQVRAVRQSAAIIGPWGSAMHLVLFTHHRPSVHLLSGTYINENYVLQADAASAPHRFFNGSLPSRDEADGSPDQAAFDFPAAADYLHAAGLVGSPARLAP